VQEKIVQNFRIWGFTVLKVQIRSLCLLHIAHCVDDESQD
jgi:hypothetical protein